MSRSQYGPAAGASGGAAPRLAGLKVPDFMRLEGAELVKLLDVLRDPIAVHLYLLLLVQMQYSEGHFLGTYARLMDLMTPPTPERGRRLPGPSYKQIRRALDTLISLDMVRRDEQNETQGQLRLWLQSRRKRSAEEAKKAGKALVEKARSEARQRA